MKKKRTYPKGFEEQMGDVAGLVRVALIPNTNKILSLSLFRDDRGVILDVDDSLPFGGKKQVAECFRRLATLVEGGR